MADGVIEVGPEHPLWAAWDDDDWAGATASNWMNSYVKPGAKIELTPPTSVTAELLYRMVNSMVRRGASVTVLFARGLMEPPR